ncbi:beta-1,3-galactosyltransferase brn-like [Mizuhopecten yessoensis]|uniref:Hexosyltransferase n=1 Tax=Mizuhopecten yessoensis TaxID=6573 RepID=A0A210Q3Z4_MIZYE|nr:beta-1,3-galactosyltransferase brn-like [Mizuhopecten yessoensis]XP_021367710.1 beta-1,3-galactosyltransferase brn-like [Mizuhopecten yessoensis]XP_021367711.1 beta-1,3-galactosyltransferase brn-like [Mizuhopecten yessoensis]XP_021367712.1 beta-1,3-galactosyltransferase brn-like [Mizuhopecten yessoensis]XP_021367713.1 beta-1,3-galactosyltransferase brn-like [Mizuhopecten yessoensis]OWF43467.1 Beta-1,3-galactosyltransferase brn [Mizuhopecten yessoensis]
MKILRRRCLKTGTIFLITLTVFAMTFIIREYSKDKREIPFHMFHYPLDINLREVIINISKTGKTSVKPINVYPYTYVKRKENICESKEEITLLFMIKSAPGNFDQRQAIRETWANRKYFKQDIIRHAFLLALTTNASINDRLSLEEETHNDILQMTYVDNYYRNTYKTIGGINWCVKYCPKAKFVMMVDDDFYVATDFLLEYLHGLPSSTVRSLFAGYVFDDIPQRGPTQKWYMPYEVYPFDKYPPFISAGAVILSMEFVKKLQIAIPFTKHFKFDDVFLAIIVYKLDVKPINLSGIHIIKRIPFEDEQFNTTIASHFYANPNDMRTAWFYHLKTLSFRNS